MFRGYPQSPVITKPSSKTTWIAGEYLATQGIFFVFLPQGLDMSYIGMAVYCREKASSISVTYFAI
jgi:hypothetical protein